MIDNTYLQNLLKFYGVNAMIAGSSENIFFSVYDLIPGKGCTINKIKRVLPDISAITKSRIILETNNGIQLKIEKAQRDIIYSYDFTMDISGGARPEELPLIIGQSENGEKLFFDLVKAPHILVGGSTGSGKSVFIHNLILSLIYGGKSSIILVDVKRVEFSLYANIPQLAHKIIDDPCDCLQMLKNLCATMDSRYKTLQENKCRNIQELRKNGGKMQYITLFIDELADLVLQNPKLEYYLIRIAQLGRAAGIHLILATQRPDYKILSGLIRANVPTRVCFSTQKATDSRIILDQSGGEKLHGSGDGLFCPIGTKELTRFQAPFTSTEAIQKIVELAKEAG